MEKFVQLISGGLETRDLFSPLSQSDSAVTSHALSLFPLLALCFLWLNMHFQGKSKDKYSSKGKKGKDSETSAVKFSIHGGSISLDLAAGLKDVTQCVSANRLVRFSSSFSLRESRVL